MNDPLVSIIIPTYNHARFLPRSLSSALAQTWPNREIIVIDDGSTDETRHVLTQFNGNIRYHYQPNAGLGAARNAGLRLARGQFIQLLDADDTISPEKISRQISHLMTDDSIDLVYSNYETVKDGMTELKDYDDPPETQDALIRYYIRCNMTPLNSPLFRSRVFQSFGTFDEDRTAQEDWDFMMRLAIAGCRFKFVPGPFAQYHRDGSVITKDHELMYQRYQHMIEKFRRDPLFLRFGDDLLHEFIYHQNIYIGHDSYNHRCWDRARRHLIEAIRSHREGFRPDLWILVLKTIAHQIIDRSGFKARTP